jgi:hypothetical protein
MTDVAGGIVDPITAVGEGNVLVMHSPR